MTVVDHDLSGRPAPSQKAAQLASERAKRLRGRNLAVLAGLIGLVALFYGITVVRMSMGH